ncbi:hypothetical protein K432DRAFT_461658, partial [Lepidopterella palustris CBS 459.81]
TQAFDKCKEHPAHIEQILDGLDRYNPETTTTFDNHISRICQPQYEEKFFDVYACSRYQFNPHLTHPETATNILVKALTVFL